MPYRITDEAEGLYITLYGDVTFKELRKANAEGWEHPGWQHHRYQIWDHRDVARFELDASQLHAIAAMDNVAFRTTGGLNTALIIDQPEILEVVESYLSSVDGDVAPARVFGDEAPARAWTGRPSED